MGEATRRLQAENRVLRRAAAEKEACIDRVGDGWESVGIEFLRVAADFSPCHVPPIGCIREGGCPDGCSVLVSIARAVESVSLKINRAEENK